MKKLLLLFLLLACAPALYAQDFIQNYSFVTTGTKTPGTSFANTGVTSFFMSWSPQTSMNTCSVQVDSSADGSSWGSGDLIASQTCTTAGSATLATLGTGKFFVRVNVTVMSGNGGLNITLKGWGGGTVGGAAALAGNANAIYASPGCPNPSSGNCYFVNANWKYFFGNTTTISITSGNSTVTCIGCFTSTAVDGGKMLFASNNGSAIAADVNALTSVSMWAAGTIPTISSVTDTGHAVVSANPTGTCTTACNLFFGTDDNALWTAIDTAISSSNVCISLILPAGVSNFTSAHWISQSANCGISGSSGQTNVNTLTNFGGTISGQGPTATMIMLTPNFNFASCTGTGVAISNGCIGTLENITMSDFTLWGGGVSNTGNNAKTLLAPGSGGTLINIGIVGFGAADTSLVGVNFNYGTAYNVKEDGVGNIGCQVSSFAWNYFVYCLDNTTQNMSVPAGNTLHDYGGSYGGIGVNGATLIRCGGTCYLHNSSRTYVTAGFSNQFIQMSSGSAVAYLDGVYDAAPSATQTGLYMPTSGAKVYVQNSSLKGGASAQAFLGSAGTTLFDNGGNTWTGNMNLSGTVLVADGHSVKGKCTGVGTAASTLGLYGTGSNVTLTTCTSTTIGSGLVVSGARTALALVVSATAAGTNASSGVVTVLKNGAATTITCTIGTGTSCVDSTHTVAFADGDLISIQFTTQAADTLAGVSAIVEWE